MRDGFIKVAAGTPEIRVADCVYNAQQCAALIGQAAQQGVKVLCLPELCLTGYTCADLFLQDTLLQGAEDALETVLEATKEVDMLIAVGLPVRSKWDNKLYNCAAVFHKGVLLGLVPKTYIPNYGEFYEQRWFASGAGISQGMELCGQSVCMEAGALLQCESMPNLVVGVEICEDLWAPAPPSVALARAGATLILNLSASNETVGKASYRRSLVSGQSGRLMCGYVYADAGEGESTTDLVFAGHNLIAENGTILAEKRFEAGLTISEIDVDKLVYERRRIGTFTASEKEIWRGYFDLELEDTVLTRSVEKNPFVPADRGDREARCQEILTIAALGLKKRLAHTHAKTAVVGLSGGLDSTLALIITARAMDLLGRPRTDITAITMPCFGTTSRTRSNAQILCQALGTDFRCIDIGPAVRQHFQDIGQAFENQDVTFENSQARERTQVLMDVANMEGGLVIGTGDLSELALGWATYNGDHMSMYGVNAGVPKTLVRHLVTHCAATAVSQDLSRVLLDILDTPVSPELLPAQNGRIAQVTEDLVGPYQLHDFFLYHMLRYGTPPDKLRFLANAAFQGVYDPATIDAWLHTFLRRFFAQQFKRSCLPDGPKIGSVALSPRGDWRMPSDAEAAIWLE